MLRADGVVYFHLFLFNSRTMRDAGNARQMVCKRRNMERIEKIAVIRLHSDDLEKFWQGLGEFHLDPGFVWSTGARWIETTNNVRVYLHGGVAENWQKYRSQTTCSRPLTRLGHLFQNTNLGKTGALNAKSRWTKIQGARKIHTAQKKDLQQAEVEQFLTLIFVSSRCTS